MTSLGAIREQRARVAEALRENARRRSLLEEEHARLNRAAVELGEAVLDRRRVWVMAEGPRRSG